MINVGSMEDMRTVCHQCVFFCLVVFFLNLQGQFPKGQELSDIDPEDMERLYLQKELQSGMDFFSLPMKYLCFMPVQHGLVTVY